MPSAGSSSWAKNALVGVGPAQFLDLALRVLDAPGLCRTDARLATGINLSLLDPIQQRLRNAANLRCD